MKAAKTTVRGIPSIGLFATVFEDLAIVGRGVEDSFKKTLRDILNVEVIEQTISGTSLIGIFLVGYRDKVIVPHIIKEDELNNLRDVFSEVLVVESKNTALGNLIVPGKSLILASKIFESNVLETISNFFGKPVYTITIGKFPLVGSSMYYHNNTILVGNIIKPRELKILKDTLKDHKIVVGSINFGSPYIRAGLLLNSNGFVVGSETTGHEILTIEETFF